VAKSLERGLGGRKLDNRLDSIGVGAKDWRLRLDELLATTIHDSTQPQRQGRTTLFWTFVRPNRSRYHPERLPDSEPWVWSGPD